MKALASLPLLYQPGDRFFYSLATDVLGFIVGRVAGKDFRDVLMERIFQPLGMVDTDFYIHPEKRDRAAVVYRMVEDTGALEPVGFRRTDTPPAYCGGGGGLVSTADDYLKFARMLLNDGEVDGVRLLKAETVADMRANRLTDAQRAIPFMGMPFWIGQGFGLGLSVILDAESAGVDGRVIRRLIRLAGRLRHLVAGRSGPRHDPDLPRPELHAPRPRSHRQHGPEHPHGRETGPAAMAEGGVRGGALAWRIGGRTRSPVRGPPSGRDERVRQGWRDSRPRDA